MISFLVRRLIAILATLLVVTLILYGIAMLTPLEDRAMLYFPKTDKNLSPQETQAILNRIIHERGLDQSFPVQYGRWLAGVAQGNWGYSPTLHEDVLDALITSTPPSAELMLYSLLLLIPLGIASGVHAAGRQGRWEDAAFRLGALVATALPPFILGIVLLSIFYVGLYWFPIGRLGEAEMRLVSSTAFHSYTGLVTVDGLLNGRPDITLEALRHLVLPVFTLSLVHWATLARITRATAIEELDKPYILAARSRGNSQRRVLWRHTLGNVLIPALNSSALSAASLVTGLFIIEVVFLYNGLSSLFTQAMHISAMGANPDVPLALGFSIYSVIAILILMTCLDILQAVLDPRLRGEEVLL